MRRFYEDLWERLPEQLDPPERARRVGFLHAWLQPGLRVLDLGCGDGWALEEAPGDVEWTGVDVAEGALKRARARGGEARWERVEAGAPLPFPDGSFELVWCSETLEHVADTAGVLAEARRVLVPGGRLALTVPDHPRLRTALRALVAFEETFPPLGDHLRFYTLRALREVLDDAGFEDVRVARSGPLLLGSGRRPGLSGP